MQTLYELSLGSRGLDFNGESTETEASGFLGISRVQGLGPKPLNPNPLTLNPKVLEGKVALSSSEGVYR